MLTFGENPTKMNIVDACLVTVMVSNVVTICVLSDHIYRLRVDIEKCKTDIDVLSENVEMLYDECRLLKKKH
jgi:hypothetical protein